MYNRLLLLSSSPSYRSFFPLIRWGHGGRHRDVSLHVRTWAGGRLSQDSKQTLSEAQPLIHDVAHLPLFWKNYLGTRSQPIRRDTCHLDAKGWSMVPVKEGPGACGEAGVCSEMTGPQLLSWLIEPGQGQPGRMLYELESESVHLGQSL